MAKNVTPEMLRVNKGRLNKKGQVKHTTPMSEAWRRLARNRAAIIGMIIISALVLIAIFAPLIIPYEIDEMDSSAMLSSPTLAHLFGTDKIGRDMLSRCLYAARITMPIAFFSVLVAVLVGGTIGVIAAYFGGTTDNLIMRVMDILGSIPGQLLAIAIVACFGNSLIVLVLGLSIGAVPNMARTFRGAVFMVVDNEYVEASRALGASNFRIMAKHLLPNAVGPIIISVVGLLGIEVLSVSTLSFIGVGVTPPTPEWGSLLSAGKEFMSRAPYLCVFPGGMIMLSVLGFNLLGDGLRDALDPRLK